MIINIHQKNSVYALDLIIDTDNKTYITGYCKINNDIDLLATKKEINNLVKKLDNNNYKLKLQI